MTEIKIAIDNLSDGESPGLDGIPIEFYKIYWLDLKEIFLELYSFILNLINQKTSAVILINRGKKGKN